MRAFVLSLVLLSSGIALAQSARSIDTEKSKLTVSAYKSGLFSFAGHDHVISAPIAAGSLDEKARTIEFTVRTKEMKVLDPAESEKNRNQIRETMLGDKLLDAERFVEIRFRSITIQQASPTEFNVQGELTLHGVTRPITIAVTRKGETYTGTTKLKQTDFGLTPVSVAGGTVKVKDEVKVEFSVVAK